ncbi:MAG TPA: hypothetical protein DDX85_11890 [Nitrospiraceae bacterium]|nr:hypothetical protein [Nitrospiraceae bacterium]
MQNIYITGKENSDPPKIITDKITCPKCGHQQQDHIECRKCGIIFAKYKTVQSSEEQTNMTPESTELSDDTDRWLGMTGKLAVIGLMSFFFIYMVIKRSSWCFLDYVNLPFHETGHILFGPFGETVQFLGGTISQLMWPFILIIYFMMRNEQVSASFCLFWFGENFLNISKYVADARSMGLPLVGGGIHDWNFLLGKWHVLKYDHTIANVIFIIGVIIMIGAIGWAFFVKPKSDNRES